MLRFVPGILLVQVATWALVAVALAPGAERIWLPLAALGLAVTGIAGLWFAAIADHARKDALTAAERHFARERERLGQAYARERESLSSGFAREREQLRVSAETEKLAALESTHQRIVRETGRAERRANLKLGIGLLGLLSVGGLLVAVEFMTLGLLLFTAGGGALGGYLARARQDSRALQRRVAAEGLEPPPPLMAIADERVAQPPARKRFGRRKQ